MFCVLKTKHVYIWVVRMRIWSPLYRIDRYHQEPWDIWEQTDISYNDASKQVYGITCCLFTTRELCRTESPAMLRQVLYTQLFVTVQHSIQIQFSSDGSWPNQEQNRRFFFIKRYFLWIFLSHLIRKCFSEGDSRGGPVTLMIIFRIKLYAFRLTENVFQTFRNTLLIPSLALYRWLQITELTVHQLYSNILKKYGVLGCKWQPVH